MIGTLIDGSYRVDRMIGRGGFGVVYECHEVDLGRSIAVKMLNPGVSSERELRRFLSEGRNLASLNHPNVVQIYRLGKHEGQPYIAMELVRGRTLRQILASERLTARRGLEIMRQVASGLADIHQVGILHRDLSPNNIVVTESGAVKILDFGFSKDMSLLTSPDSRETLVGTLAYVSPEQIEGTGNSVRSEVFSFGVILYEVLTGHHPFHAEHHMSLLYNIAQREPDPIERHLPRCPAALSVVVMACLDKRPEARPGTMTEVEAALAEVLVSSGLDVAAATTPPPRSPRATPRNPYLNRVMIKHREDFFGRAQELQRIFARLNATPPGSISIVGDRKIGKSSLLNHVYTRHSRNLYLQQPETMVMVFLDLQEQKSMSMQSFVKALLGIANYELRGRMDVSDCSLDLDGIKTLVQRLDGAGFRLAILLDEFEGVTTNPNFSLEFFSFLRFLANHYNVAYLTSSARDLQVLCHTKEISDSPFFNIFSTMRLSVFPRAEAEELIRVPSERVGKPLAPHTERILELAGRFPFFIQMACSHAIEWLDEHPGATEPDFAEVGRRFFEEARLHFRYIWEGLDPHEKSTVLRVARQKSLPDSLKHVLGELEARNYVAGHAGRPRLFASTFEEFVKTEAAKDEKTSWWGKVLGRG